MIWLVVLVLMGGVGLGVGLMVAYDFAHALATIRADRRRFILTAALGVRGPRRVAVVAEFRGGPRDGRRLALTLRRATVVDALGVPWTEADPGGQYVPQELRLTPTGAGHLTFRWAQDEPLFVGGASTPS